MKQKIIVIYGPTSSGKSDYAVKLALELGKKSTEIISADSRQVYTELNLLSGKITRAEMKGVKHQMLSITSVTHDYSAATYAKQAKKVVNDILKSGKNVIICGGTGFYIDALINELAGTTLPKVKPDKKLRQKLNNLTNIELFKLLQKKDKVRAKNIDPNNKIRLIRALEIIEKLGKVPQIIKTQKMVNYKGYEVNWVGLDVNSELLKNKIKKRLNSRIRAGMLNEAKKVYKKIGGQKMRELGLECKYCAMYIEHEITLKELKEILPIKIWQYAKRQRTWFKKI